MRPQIVACGLACLLTLPACAARQTPVQSAAESSVPEAARASATPAAQIPAYVEVQVALAADDYDQAKTALGNLLTVSDAMTGPLIRSAAKADDIAAMRARFKPLSEYLAAQELPLGYAKAYCPMYDGGSSWVQADGPVRNPYFGSTMLTCGVVDAAPGAHMDHTPRHGGRVFMAPDSFHHIEGTYTEDGIFRVYATNNYREPVDVSTWSGRVVLEEEYDSATDEFIEVVAFDLQPSPEGAFLESVVDSVGLPGEFIAKLVILADSPEERFDFIFPTYSVAGDTGLADRSPATAGISEAPTNIPLAERVRPTIPELTTDVLAEISARDVTLQTLIGAGRFTEIFIPALQAKELGLALLDRGDELPPRQRNDVRIAVRHLVRAAYLLDWYGDIGNKQQVSGAYDVFARAAHAIVDTYEDTP